MKCECKNIGEMGFCGCWKQQKYVTDRGKCVVMLALKYKHLQKQTCPVTAEYFLHKGEEQCRQSVIEDCLIHLPTPSAAYMSVNWVSIGSDNG